MAGPVKPISIEKPMILLCEGEDEVSFFNAWFHELGRGDIQVLPYQGKNKLGEALDELVSASGFIRVKRVAITRDADDDAGGAKQSLQDIVKRSPVAGMNPGLFVLPDDENPGSLETLWLNSLRGGVFESCVEEFFKCIAEKGWMPSAAWSKNDKAKAQLWIATKDVPNERFGIAAWHGRRDTDKPWMKDRWVDFDHRAFAKLKSFLFAAFQ